MSVLPSTLYKPPTHLSILNPFVQNWTPTGSFEFYERAWAQPNSCEGLRQYLLAFDNICGLAHQYLPKFVDNICQSASQVFASLAHPSAADNHTLSDGPRSRASNASICSLLQLKTICEVKLLDEILFEEITFVWAQNYLEIKIFGLISILLKLVFFVERKTIAHRYFEWNTYFSYFWATYFYFLIL